MIEMFDANLDAIYSVLAVDAVIEGYADPFQVIDKTAGIDAEFGGGDLSMATLTPACCVMYEELTARGVQVENLAGLNITFNGTTWRIQNAKPRPTPNGEQAGELFLFLRKQQ